MPIMDNSLISGLTNLGLNEKQAQVYLALLKLGKGSAYAISEQSGLKKPTTYVILNELIEKGAAQLIPKVAKRLYKPVPPETLINNAEQRMSEVKQLLPALKSIVTTKPDKINVLHYEGLKAYKEALYYRIDECIGKEIVGFYAQASDLSPKLLAICEEYNTFCAKNNIVNKTFVPDHPSLTNFRKTDELFKRVTQVLPYDIYSSSVSIDTFSDIVRIVLNKNNQMVIIENKEFAKTIREIFDMLWMSHH